MTSDEEARDNSDLQADPSGGTSPNGADTSDEDTDRSQREAQTNSSSEISRYLAMAGVLVGILAALVAILQPFAPGPGPQAVWFALSLGSALIVAVLLVGVIRHRGHRWLVGIIGILVVVTLVTFVGGLAAGKEKLPQGATESATRSPGVGTPSACPSPTGPTAELVDDFQDGHVNWCIWDVDPTVSRFYYGNEGSSISVSEQEGFLVFDKKSSPDEAGDAEIFALPRGKPIVDASVNLELLSETTGSHGGGSVGIIANTADDGPIVSVAGVIGPGGPGFEALYCPFDGADYDACELFESCPAVKFSLGQPMSVRITSVNGGIEVFVGTKSCGVHPVAGEITAINLNMYADTGSEFRIAMRDFRMRYSA
jgi:hypothetical protein